MSLNKTSAKIKIASVCVILILLSMCFAGAYTIHQSKILAATLSEDMEVKYILETIGSNIKVSKNSNIGRWDDEKTKSITLHENLTIESVINADVFLYGVTAERTDHFGNIYVAQQSNAEILKFDPNGTYIKTIGKKGQGPGELSGSFSIAQHFHNNNIHVIDWEYGRYTEYSLHGSVIRSIRLPKTYNRAGARGFDVDESGNLLVGYADCKDSCTIAVYDHNINFVKRFGETVHVSGLKPFDNIGLINYASSGHFVKDGPRIYYIHSAPHLIKIYNSIYELTDIIYRENDLTPTTYELVGAQMYQTKNPSVGRFIGSWKEYIIMSILIRGVKPYSILDFYNKNGEYLTTLKFNTYTHVTHVDNHGQLYAHTYTPDGEEQIKRYQIIIKNN